MNVRYFLVNTLLLVLLIVLTAYTFQPLTGSVWPGGALYLIYAWLFIAALGGYALVDSKMKSKPRDFVNTFMLVSGLRMFCSVLIVVILVLQFPVEGKYISIYYVSGYLLFLIAEVVFLFKRSKTVQ